MIAKVNWIHEFRRMMQRVLKNKWAEQWITASLVLLFIGLLVSRALVSFVSVLIAVPFFFHYKHISSVKSYLWAIGLIIIPVLLSFFWSDDKMLWWNSLSIKLTLVTMMLGLLSVSLSDKRWIQITWLYLFIISLGCGWSLWQYANNYIGIQESYLQSKLLPTPADNDHIRFSWMVVAGIFIGTKCLVHEKKKITRVALIVILLFLKVYLHILASKTGIVCFYTGCIIYLLYISIIQKKWKQGLGIAGFFIAIASICYFTMPTLRNRVQYVLYDFSNYSKGHTLPGYSDAARWQSIKAGYSITTQHPVSGVGFGDMLSAINQWHNINHPSSFGYERFLPANEWLVYGAGSGWPGLLCFAAGFALLLYYSTSKNVWSIILSVISVIPFLIDDTLEGQTGVVVLAFIVFFGQQKLKEPPVVT